MRRQYVMRIYTLEAAENADGASMNGIQIERLLSLIDGNIQASMQLVRPDILNYLANHSHDLALEIAEKGYGVIPTRAGEVKVSREDLKAA